MLDDLRRHRRFASLLRRVFGATTTVRGARGTV
jgi:hypothetical protein